MSDKTEPYLPPGAKSGQILVWQDGQRVWVDPPPDPLEALRAEVRELRERVAMLEQRVAAQASAHNPPPRYK